MPDLTIVYDEKADWGPLYQLPAALRTAELEFHAVVAEWFQTHGGHIHATNHFLHLSSTKIYWSKERTRYERSADLVLKADAAHRRVDKVLQEGAVQFALEWRNAPAEAE